jgi:hypothetical protein
MDLVHGFLILLSSFCIFAVKLTGKLQDGTVFLKKGHGDDEAELFEFTTDEGNFFRRNVFTLSNKFVFVPTDRSECLLY